MKCKIVKFGLMLCFFFGGTSLRAQTFYIEESDGAMNSISLNNVRKIIFSQGVLSIQEFDSNSSFFDLSNLSSFRFDHLITNSQASSTVIGSNLSVYPNPVTDILHLDCADKRIEGFVEVFDFYGNVVFQQKIAGESIVTMDLGALYSGVYYCSIPELLEGRLIRIIKE